MALIGARNEDWKGVHPSNIHPKGYRPLNMGYRSHNEYRKGAHPSNIHHEEYRPLHMGFRGTR